MTTTPVTETQKKRLIKPSRGQARFAFTILLIINILNYADRYVLSAVLPQIKHEFNMTDFQGGLLISSFLIVYAVTTLPIGIWADRGIRKNIVAICVGVWSVATTFAGFTRNLFQLFSMRSILGIGEAGYAPASLSLLGDFFSKTHRGRILSFWSIGTLIGAAIGVSVGGRIADTLGWRWAFYIVGIPGLIAAFLAWRIKEPKRGVFDTEEGESGENAADTSTAHGKIDQNFWGTARALLRIPTYWVLLGALTFSFFTIGGTSFWLTTYLTRAFSLSLTEAGSVSGIVLIVTGLTGTIIGGWLADFLQSRRPQGRMITSVLGFLLGAPLVLVALSIHIFPVFIGVFVVAAISLNFCTGPLNAVIQDVIAPDMRATAVGLALLLAHLLGDAAAPTVIGFISDISSLGTALLVTAPLFLFLAGLVSLIGVKTVASDMRRMQEQLRAR
ncbi:MAG TPA: MFS transporter [Ktedonobacteraceae bacterium]|nr:MFS transporter [Ktedonobacteraceae bacterium]